jgi:hypothetical protein
MTFQSSAPFLTMPRTLTVIIGADPALDWSRRSFPTAYVVNATPIVGMKGLLLASSMLPICRPVRPGFPSLKMIAPLAPAAVAFRTLTPKLHPPRWIRATLPGVKPLKSAMVQPLVELEVGVGGMTMPPAGSRGAPPGGVAPVLCPGPQSVRSS